MFGFLLTGSSFSGLIDNTAYLDPGSGSFIIQLILAPLLGGLLILRTSWTKVKDFLIGLFNRDKDGDEKDE